MIDQAWATAYVGLGSNLEDPVSQVQRAIHALNKMPQSRYVEASSLYRTTPVGITDQPEFINAVVRLETHLQPLELLGQLQLIESNQGRKRTQVQWGPRTLDLDLLLYDQQQLSTQALTLPHPRLVERAFVLAPLAEIVPQDLNIPGAGRLCDLLDRISLDGVRSID